MLGFDGSKVLGKRPVETSKFGKQARFTMTAMKATKDSV
jgi:hypothetical protein